MSRSKPQAVQKETVVTKTFPCPALADPWHDETCSLCHGEGVILIYEAVDE